MRISHALSGLAFASFALSAHALDFSEGFGNVAALSASGWQLVNASPVPDQPWFQGNGTVDGLAGVFDAQAGPPTSYIAASFLSSASGPIANWLITPVLNISDSSVLSFFTRTADAGPGLADQLDVLFSPGFGSGTSGFTLLGSVGAGGTYPLSWTSFAFDLPDVASGRVAFRQGGAFETADYIGLDTVNVTLAVAPIPEPSTYAMLALGLGFVAIMRRRRLRSIP